MQRPTHPLQTWLTSEGLDYAGAAKLCKKLGRAVGKTWLEQICRGYYPPGYPLARFLGNRLTAGAVPVDAIMEFPYTLRRAAA